MNIYIDLDETLIFTEVMINGLGGEPFKFRLGGWDYYTHLRPSAFDLLNRCRAFGNIKMLTNATYDYASLINEHFGFGFAPESIISRHDYVTYQKIGRKGEIELPKPSIKQYDAILIDNMFADDPGAINKMTFLGIRDSRFIHVPDFQGEADTLDLDYIDERLFQILSA